MDRFLLVILVCLFLVIPANAADLSGGDLDASSLSVPDDTVVSSDSIDKSVALSDPVVLAENEKDVSALTVSDSLTGGYYFVCDCALGSDIKFYVPLEWAHNVFTFNDEGSPVNMSQSTCYAYCPAFPSYTFSCTRFSTFTYRLSNYSSQDLNITNVSDTNIQFMMDEGFRLSDSDILVFIASLLFILLVGSWILRR